jgi:hypothetical protein
VVSDERMFATSVMVQGSVGTMAKRNRSRTDSTVEMSKLKEVEMIKVMRRETEREEKRV